MIKTHQYSCSKRERERERGGGGMEGGEVDL